MRALAIAVGWGLVAAIIWASVSQLAPQIPAPQGDKLGHLIAYGGAMFWFAQLYRGTRARLAYAAGFIAMGIALEFVQRALGYRSFEVLDMATDALGVGLGWGLALVLAPLLK
jgi:hypothetical protein